MPRVSASRELLASRDERLILDAMLGDATLFTRIDEVEEQWKLVDAIVAAWSRDRPAFPNYPAGTWGPPSAQELLKRDGRSWRRPVVDLGAPDDRDRLPPHLPGHPHLEGIGVTAGDPPDQ